MIKKHVVYAIRQKSTGFYFPIHWNSSGYYSYDEPVDNCFPRLFKSKISAQNAINSWCKGIWSKQTIQVDSYESFYPTYEETEPYPEYVEGRNKEDLEIVSMEIDLGAFLPL